MDFEAARPGADDPLLLYSLAEFAEIIFEAFEIAGVRTVLEIGSEAGLFTERLVEWVANRDGQLISVDPAPSPKVRHLAETTGRVRLVEGTSHDALPGLEPADAYLVDGDHNYFTVAGELRLIHEAAASAGRHPLLLVQDVSWPTGLRDMYYAPESLPAEAVHAYVYSGVVPWEEGTVVAGGFRGEGEFAYSRHEGGPANGVLRALEDFLSSTPGYVTIAVPCVFGLAVVFPEAAPWADELRRRLGFYDDNPVLARLEANRIRLYLEVLSLNDRMRAAMRTSSSRLAAMEAELEEARTSAAVAWQETRRARDDLEAIRRSSPAAADTAPKASPLQALRRRAGV